ncbi:MAG: hypothetical protein ACYC9O_00985 [Candidatus Latescibacterota bacterium]
MEETLIRTDEKVTRREILRKTGKFVIPTLVTFHITDLKAQVSGEVRTLGRPQGPPSWQ